MDYSFKLYCVIMCIITHMYVVCTSKSQTYSAEKLRCILEEENFYNRNVAPNFNKDPATIKVQLLIQSIDDVNEEAMDYSLTLYLRQEWQDPRLCTSPECLADNAHNCSGYNVQGAQGGQAPTQHHQRWRREVKKERDAIQASTNITPYLNRMELESSFLKQIWQPDTFFINERTARVHTVTTDNKMTHLYEDGTIIYSMRLSMTLTCLMHLEKYPFDSQKCPLIVSSYGYTTDILKYTWAPNPIIVRDVLLPTYEVNNFATEELGILDEGIIGQFSRLKVVVTLDRSYGYYIAQVYIPTILIVILSWVNFWLDIDAIPARISVGLLTVLTVTTMGVGAKSNLPRVSYVKALDVWFMVCLLFVFAALLEFAFVNVTSRVNKRRQSLRDMIKSGGPQGLDAKHNLNASKNPFTRGTTSANTKSRMRARMVDKIARIVFPISFGFFNIVYWSYYFG